VVLDDLGDGLAEGAEDVRRSLEDVHVETVGGEGLGHLDADVAAADDGDSLGRLHRAVPLDEVAVDVRLAAHVSECVLARVEQVGSGRGRRVQPVDGERAVEAEPLDGVGQRPRTGRDEQVTVRLLEALARPVLDRHRLRVGVDADHLVAPVQVDAALGDVLGRQRQQVLQRVDLALDEVRFATVGVGDPLALLVDDHLAVGGLAFALARGAQAGRVSTDDDERVRHTYRITARHQRLDLTCR
jgi:hypothetical protein